MKTKFAIGCLVQWYECDIVEEYIESLKEAIEEYGTPRVDVEVHFTVSMSQKLEKCVSKEQLKKCRDKIHKLIHDNLYGTTEYKYKLYTIATTAIKQMFSYGANQMPFYLSKCLLY